MSDIFEKGSRLKVTFDYKGNCPTEDLWELDRPKLKKIYVGLRADLKELVGETLLDEGDGVFGDVTSSKECELIQLKIAIVKHIALVLREEGKAKEMALQKRELKQKVRNIMADIEDNSLRNKPMEELQQILDS